MLRVFKNIASDYPEGYSRLFLPGDGGIAVSVHTTFSPDGQ